MGSFKQRLAFDIIQKLQELASVPLKDLDRVTEEIETLGREFTGLTGSLNQDRYDGLREFLFSIHKHLYTTLGACIDPRILQHLAGLLKCPANQLHAPNVLDVRREDVNELAVRSEVQNIIRSYLLPSLNQLSSTPSDPKRLAEGTAHGCINLFLGCLVLFVPDRPFDPSLMSRVAKSIWNRQRDELEAKLHALRNFEYLANRQTTSFRCRRLEKDIESLGPGPPSHAPRPGVSKFSALHNEFANLLQYVVRRCPSTRSEMFDLEDHAVEELEMVRSNISWIVSRLSDAFPDYADLTGPVVGFLHGLNVGVHLALMHHNPTFQMRAGPPEQSLLVLGPSVEDVAQIHQGSFSRTEKALNFLRRILLQKSIVSKFPENATDSLVSAVQQLYWAWKLRLESDKAKHMEKTSLYHYEAPQEDDDMVSQSELDGLFPQSSEHTGIPDTVRGPLKDAQQFSTQMAAQLIMDIFAANHDGTSAFLGAVRGAAPPLSSIILGPDDVCPFSNTYLSTLAILRLDQVANCLKVGDHRSYNFYKDSNIEMAKKLLDILQRVHQRFFALRQQWPEHALLSEVVSTVQALVNLGHSEPVATWLPRVETLHALIYEWHIIASREFSVEGLYHELTEMIVNSRRLELSTWAKLLDEEDERYRHNSTAWFFVAYQATIAVALDLEPDEVAIKQHAESLVPDIQRYLQSAAVGQFSTRLELLKLLCQLCRQFEARSPALSPISNSLRNLTRYYGRYKPAAFDVIGKGRESVEKQIKEVILLASWKDKNVNALRESSKKSRMKLYRLVRKYRTLLSEPIQPILAAPLSLERQVDEELSDIVSRHSLDSLTANSSDPQVESNPAFAEKLRHLKNPLVTATASQRMIVSSRHRFEAAESLHSFTSTFESRIHAFAKATPSKLSPENKVKVKQLKSLKRKMFADVLRQLRTMGIRYNLDATILEHQSDIGKILSSVPSAEPLYGLESHFFGFLDQISVIQADVRGHSEELTSNEVSRGMGFMNGLLFDLCRQRQVLKDSLDDFELLDKALDLSRSLLSRDRVTLPRSKSSPTIVDHNQHLLVWLSTILKTSCEVLHKQDCLGGNDTSSLRSELEQWSNKASTLRDLLQKQPVMPTGFATSAQLEIDHSIQDTLLTFLNRLDQLNAEHPSSAFILKPLGPWLSAHRDQANDLLAWSSSYDLNRPEKSRPTSTITNGLKSVEESCPPDFKSSLLKILDVAVQPIQECNKSLQRLPRSKEENGWLQMTDDSICTTLKAFSGAEVGQRLQMALKSLSGANASEQMIATYSVTFPLLELFREVYGATINKLAKLHQAQSRMAWALSETFARMLKQGFCMPSEESRDEPQAGDVQDGLGLGEGEGAKDISKDVQGDEDLTELAEQENASEDRDEIGDEPDAVDVADKSLEGNVEEGENADDASSGSNEETEDNPEDEIGSVNSGDQSRREDRMQEDQKDAGGKPEAKGQSQGSKQDEVATIEQQNASDSQEAQEENDGAGDEQDDAVVEKMDPPMNEAKAEDEGGEMENRENLDLPEDMDIDNRKESDSEMSDEDMDDLSSVEADEVGPEEANAGEEQDAAANPDKEHPETQESGTTEGEDTDVEDLQEDERRAEEEKHREQQDGDVMDLADDAPRGGVGTGQSSEKLNEEILNEENTGESNEEGLQTRESGLESAGAGGDVKLGNQEPTASRASATAPQPRDNASPIHKLGNALEKWKRKNQQILDAVEQDQNVPAKSADATAPDQEYSHLPNGDSPADAQVLGQAAEEQTRGLNQEEMDAGSGNETPSAEALMEDVTALENDTADDIAQAIGEQRSGEASGQAVLVGERIGETLMPNASIMDLDGDSPSPLTSAYPQPDGSSLRDPEEARQLWVHYERLTRELSMSLTEQLRLILAPTLKSKMRGDFRTGKRLNIKRIIPYIASGYKRDKIWMRRSIASKRSYQVMLAVDDSKSMGESGSGRLAFETLALVSKSLSFLEVGQICVVSFGNETSVAHPFDRSFSSDAGIEVFRRFTFQQKRTDVRKLISTSLEIFREAKLKQHNSSADLWQLQLIISDGICENHESIKKLVRQAHEDKIMIVFVIIDSTSGNSSIVDMTQASFQGDTNGEPSLRIQRYLESFPFNYYLIVRDVKQLPNVLANALRQWFAEVSEA